MELTMAPFEACQAWDQMPMRVPIGLGYQSQASTLQNPRSAQSQLSQQQLQQLQNLQQQLLNQQNQQHLQLLLHQQQFLQQSQQGQSQPSQPQQMQQQQVPQLPSLLTQRTVFDPMAAAAFGIYKAPVVPVPGMPAMCPWFWPMPMDPCVVGAGMMPGWGPAPHMPLIGTGVAPGIGMVLSPTEGASSTGIGRARGSEAGAEAAAGSLQMKRRGGRAKSKKDDVSGTMLPMAVGELLGAESPMAEVRRDGAKSQLMLKETLPHAIELARDAEGSRFLQAKLETANTAERKDIFEAILPEVTSLAGDASGSAVVQKLLDICTPDQRKAIIENFKGEVIKLSIKMYGCRVIQKAFQVCPPDLQAVLAAELKNGVIDCIKSMHGNHVVQKCIEQMPPDSVSFVVDAIEGRAEQMAAHIYGCRIIQRLLEHCAPKRLEKMLEQILRGISKLAADPYGNYVIRHILEHGKQEHKRRILEECCGNVLELGRDKHASNVVEKCFEASTTGEHATFLKSERQALIRAMLGDPADPNAPLLQLLDDRYGKYVVQSMVDYSRGQEEITQLFNRIKALPEKKASQNRSYLIEQLQKQMQQLKEQQQQFLQHQLLQLQQQLQQ